jgi:hypothetical protein
MDDRLANVALSAPESAMVRWQALSIVVRSIVLGALAAIIAWAV